MPCAMLRPAIPIDATMRCGPAGTLLLRRSLFTLAACALAACSGNGSSGSASAPTSAPPPMPTGAQAADVLMWHNDAARTGQYLVETTLTLANVNSASFGRTAMWPVDGRVDAQPLFASSVTLPDRSVHNLLIAATEHDSVYAFDANTGTVLWQKSTLAPGEASSDSRNCGQVAPEIGITATPAIYNERSALLVSGGVLYTAWGSHCDASPYTGWIMAFDEATLAMRSVLNVTPNGSGGAFWNAGAGPALDAGGSLFIISANG